MLILGMGKGPVPKYLVITKDNLSGASEGQALVSASSGELASFFWKEIFCRYGAMYQVTTDNGSEVKRAFAQLLKNTLYHMLKSLLTIHRQIE